MMTVRQAAHHVIDYDAEQTSDLEKLHALWMLVAAVSRSMTNVSCSRLAYSIWKSEERLQATGDQKR